MNYSGILKVLSVDEDGGVNIWERRVVKVSSSPYSLSIFKKESEEIDIEISLTDADIQSIQADSSDYDAQSQDEIKCVFIITSNEGERLYFRASHVEEMSDWVSNIKQIQQQQQQQQVFASSAPPTPPSFPPPEFLFPSPSSSLLLAHPHSSAGYLFAFDGIEGWREVFAVVRPGKLLLFYHPTDEFPTGGSYPISNAEFHLKQGSTREQIQILMPAEQSNSKDQYIHLMGLDSNDTHQWITTLKRRAVEEDEVLSKANPNLLSLAHDASIYLRRIALSVSSLNEKDLTLAKQRESDADALSFIAIGTLKLITAGSPAKFEIHRCDINGASGLGTIDPDDFEIFLSASDDVEGIGDWFAQSSAVSQSAKLAFSSEITYTKAGCYRLHIRLGRSPIFGSPFPFTVLPSDPSPKDCIISGVGATQIKENETTSFSVMLRDRYSNPARLPIIEPYSKMFQVLVSGSGVLEKIIRSDANSLGTSFEVFYRVNSSNSPASIRVDVLLDSVPIAGSPVIPFIIANPIASVTKNSSQKNSSLTSIPELGISDSNDLSSSLRQLHLEKKRLFSSPIQKLEFSESIPESERPIESPLPPWASSTDIEIQVNRKRKLLDEILSPLQDVIVEEQRVNGELNAPWKKHLLSWNGPRTNSHTLKQLHSTFIESPVDNRDLICQLIQSTLETEKELYIRKSLELQKNASASQMGVGDRVFLGESHGEGTIRYYGSVQFAKGNWIGVELDQPTGRSDGTYMGVRYFECEKNKGRDSKRLYGIFMRPEDVKYLSDTSAFNDNIKNDSFFGNNGLYSPTNSEKQSRNDHTRPTNGTSASISAEGVYEPSKKKDVNAFAPTSNSFAEQNISYQEQNNGPRTKSTPQSLSFSHEDTSTLSPAPSAAATPKSTDAIQNNNSYPDTPEWKEVEKWLYTQGLSRPFERKSILDAFVSFDLISLQRISRLTPEKINQMPLSFELRMKLLSKSKDLAKKLLFTSLGSSTAVGVSPTKEVLMNSTHTYISNSE